MGAPAQFLSGGRLCEPLCLPLHKEVIVNTREVFLSLSPAKPFAQVPHFVLKQTLGDGHYSYSHFPDGETEFQSQEVEDPGSKSAFQDLS